MNNLPEDVCDELAAELRKILSANPRASKFTSSRKEVASTAEAFEILAGEFRKLRVRAVRPEKRHLRFAERMDARKEVRP